MSRHDFFSRRPRGLLFTLVGILADLFKISENNIFRFEFDTLSACFTPVGDAFGATLIIANNWSSNLKYFSKNLLIIEIEIKFVESKS